MQAVFGIKDGFLSTVTSEIPNDLDIIYLLCTVRDAIHDYYISVFDELYTTENNIDLLRKPLGSQEITNIQKMRRKLIETLCDVFDKADKLALMETSNAPIEELRPCFIDEIVNEFSVCSEKNSLI